MQRCIFKKREKPEKPLIEWSPEIVEIYFYICAKQIFVYFGTFFLSHVYYKSITNLDSYPYLPYLGDVNGPTGPFKPPSPL